MKKFILLFLVVMFLAVPALAEMKIGVVDIRKAISDSEAGKSTETALEKEKKDFEQELRQLEVKLKSLDEALRTQADMLKPGALADKKREFEKEVMAAQRFEQERGSKLQRKIQEQIGSLQESFMKIASDLSKEEGYDFVFERTTMIYALDAADFTEKVTAAANKSLKK